MTRLARLALPVVLALAALWTAGCGQQPTPQPPSDDATAARAKLRELGG